ncbi:MAG: hypothetical protein LBB98_11240 [Treponema sp.]|jgi:hypothetical protein|nr:hypothetical protein [Treponema sp.]
MKNAKLTGLFAKSGRLYASLLPGFLAAILLAGCFNPITAIPPKTGDPVTDPFTVDIFIGKDGSARTVAGPDSARIKGDNIRNFVQLVVFDKTDQKIVALAEDRRTLKNSEGAVLSINSIAFGKKYDFLLLMGHWEHDGNYTYDESEPPTLLAAGLKEIDVTGSGKITVVMWPIVVDTEFRATGNRTAAPVVSDGKPGKVSLLPVDWGVRWMVKKGSSGNGFESLVTAQKVINGEAGEDLLVTDKQAIVTAAGQRYTDALLTVAENVITLGSIGSYTAGITKIGTVGSVQFRLEYVPFNVTDVGIWDDYQGDSKFDLDGTKTPVWVIRNGINDEAQNATTDFSRFGNEAGYNGNGAVTYVVAAATPQPGDLVIRDGKFEGPSSSKTPNIGFTTAGYEGTAGVYYAAVEVPNGGTTTAPAYTAYTKNLDPLAVGVHTGKQITLPDELVNYDVYVILFQNGKVSAPVKINTKKGGLDVDNVWGSKFIAVSGSTAVMSEDGGKTWTMAALPGGGRAISLRGWRICNGYQ